MKFEPNLTRPCDPASMCGVSTSARVNKTEMYGAADVKAFSTMM